MDQRFLRDLAKIEKFKITLEKFKINQDSVTREELNFLDFMFPGVIALNCLGDMENADPQLISLHERVQACLKKE